MEAGCRPLKRFGNPASNAKLKGDLTMRFMMVVKHAENSGAPPKELMDAIAKLSEEAVKAGTMVASGGLAPTAASTRIRGSRGQITTTDGPFTQAKEIVGRIAIFYLNSNQEPAEDAIRVLERSNNHVTRSHARTP